MIKPASFVKLTSLYILLCFLLIDISLFFKLLNMPHIDLLLFIAFPSLIIGTLFQIYPTIQGIRIRWEWLTYLHFLIVLLNLSLLLWESKLYWPLYLPLSIIGMVFLILNTRNLREPTVIFFLLGGVYFLLASVLALMGLSGFGE